MVMEDRLAHLEDYLQNVGHKLIELEFLSIKKELDICEKREAMRLGQIAKKKWRT